MKSVAGEIFVGGSIELGDDDLVVAFEGGSEGGVSGSKGFAVAAPFSVDLDEDELVLLAGDFVVVAGGQFDDGSADEGGDGDESNAGKSEDEGAHFWSEFWFFKRDLYFFFGGIHTHFCMKIAIYFLK